MQTDTPATGQIFYSVEHDGKQLSTFDELKNWYVKKNAKEKNLSPDFDYAFFGPVFSSISKINYISVIEDDLNLSLNKTSTKIIAIGGINEENIKNVFDMGFDGAAVLGAIWQKPKEAVNNFKNIHDKCSLTAR